MIALNVKSMKRSKATLLHLMLCATLLVDYLNGMLRGLHLGEIFRVALIALCLCILMDNRSRFAQCMAIFGFLFVNIAVSWAVYQNPGSVVYDISVALKSTLVFLICAALLELHRRGKIDGQYIEGILRANLIYGPGLFLLSKIMGRGSSSYGWNDAALGFKSEFMSLNAVNAALIVLYLYAITKVLHERHRMKWIACSVYVIIPMVMLGTKTGIAMIVLVPMWMFLVNHAKKRVWITVGALLVLVLAALPFVYGAIVRAMTSILERQRWLFQHRDFTTYLFSTRNERLVRSLDYYFRTLSPIDVFPGRGYFEFHQRIVFEEVGTVIPIEMDWADILTAYGPAGFLFTYVFAFGRLFRAKGHLKSKMVQVCFWSAAIMVLFGTLAGHVFLEAISATFLAVVCGGTVIFASEDRARTARIGEDKG